MDQTAVAGAAGMPGLWERDEAVYCRPDEDEFGEAAHANTTPNCNPDATDHNPAPEPLPLLLPKFNPTPTLTLT